MEAIRTLIGEGDTATRNTLLQKLEHELDFEVVGACETAAQVIATANETGPDLLLIDTIMAGTSGFSVLKAVTSSNRPDVIFVAESEEYAARAFDVGAADYLVKPVTQTRLAVALDRARGLLQLHHETNGNGSSQESLRGYDSTNCRCLRWIVVKSADKVQFVATDEIDWIEAHGDNLILHVGAKQHAIRGTMKAMEQKLDPERFLRIHRSTIVNLNRLEELQPYFHGEFVVVLNDGTNLRLSRGRRQSLEQFLGQPI
jgi:two-component system LytT family response regulator